MGDKKPNCKYGYCEILDKEGICIISQAFNGRNPSKWRRRRGEP